VERPPSRGTADRCDVFRIFRSRASLRRWSSVQDVPVKPGEQACGHFEEAEEIALIKRRWNEYRWKAAMENRKAVA
jgi:hypothetical protein